MVPHVAFCNPFMFKHAGICSFTCSTLLSDLLAVRVACEEEGILSGTP